MQQGLILAIRPRIINLTGAGVNILAGTGAGPQSVAKCLPGPKIEILDGAGDTIELCKCCDVKSPAYA